MTEKEIREEIAAFLEEIRETVTNVLLLGTDGFFLRTGKLSEGGFLDNVDVDLFLQLANSSGLDWTRDEILELTGWKLR